MARIAHIGVAADSFKRTRGNPCDTTRMLKLPLWGLISGLALFLCACGEAVPPDPIDPTPKHDAGGASGDGAPAGEDAGAEDAAVVADAGAQTDAGHAGSDAGPVVSDAGVEPGDGLPDEEDAGMSVDDDAGIPIDPIPQDPACFGRLQNAGEEPLCASCACGRCAAEASACAGDPACGAALACMHEQGCTGIACYCTSDLLGCAFSVRGACKNEFESAVGQVGKAAIELALANPVSSLGKAQAAVSCTRTAARCKVACSPAAEACAFHDLSCQQRACEADPVREAERAASAARDVVPQIARVRVNGREVYRDGQGSVELRPSDAVVLEGTGFGGGTSIDFSKILIGHVRVLEDDLTMYEQTLDIATQVHAETPTVRSAWPRDILGWTDTRIEFKVPKHVTRGPLRVQVQKRTGANTSYVAPDRAHAVVDALTLRITDPAFQHRCDVVSTLSETRTSNEIPLVVRNDGLDALVKKGREIFWSYDYNIGLTHKLRGLDWTAIMEKRTTDPVTGLVADPLALFGAYPAMRGEVPDEALDEVYFDPYPQKNPIPGFLLVLSSQKVKGNTRSSGYVGYRYAESTNPYTGDGQWIGFNCASCHGYRVTWESSPGTTRTRVIPGLPNPRWSMKWALLGEFKGVKVDEPGPLWDPTTRTVDKTALIYAVPAGHGEHDTVRAHGEGSMTDNDYGFAPIAIPNVTYYLPIRRSLGHTESYVGFEGSYIHSEEPDGALGSMDAASLQALTAYMAQLDGYDDQLRKVGLYRWLAFEGRSDVHGNLSEGAFVQTDPRSHPALAERLGHGESLFRTACGSCHEDGVGQFTNEKMLPLHEVGRFFEPTVYQREMQSTRVTFLRDLYFTQHRGLLTDGHVRSIEDLVHPDRCREGTPLYDRYYTLHAPTTLPSAGPDYPQTLPGENVRGHVFRVRRSTDGSASGAAQNAFVERYRYFTRVPWDEAHYYWDYQKMRREYGPWELGSAMPIGLPAAPHPWCAERPEDVADLTLYLMSL